MDYKLLVVSDSRRLVIILASVICPLISGWGCSSAGRAPALHAGGHRFEPVHLHQSDGEEQSFPLTDSLLFDFSF